MAAEMRLGFQERVPERAGSQVVPALNASANEQHCHTCMCICVCACVCVSVSIIKDKVMHLKEQQDHGRSRGREGGVEMMEM